MSSHIQNSSAAGFKFSVPKFFTAPPEGIGHEKILQSLLAEPADRLPSHIPALDGIRGLAVLMVLFCHAMQRPFHEVFDSFVNPADKSLLTLARISWVGVDLFFVLSGFLITGILFDAKGKDHFFRNFYARRTVRIFPLYYACLVLFLIIWPMLPAALSVGFGTIPTSEAWYWAYLSNFSQAISEQSGKPVHHILQVSWSLAIEEQFYLCWPLVVFSCSRKTLLRVCAGMFFGSMALRAALLATGMPAWAMGFTPCRVDGLAVGAAIALIARGPGGIRSLVKPSFWVAPLAAIAVAGLIVGMNLIGYRRGVGQSPGYIIGGTALFSMLFGAILVLSVAGAGRGMLQRFFSHPLLRMYGKYSYAVYLLHLPIMILVGEYVFHPSRLMVGTSMIPGMLVYFALTWTLSLLAAIVSWNVMEKHCLKLKDYFPLEAKH